MRTNLCFRGTTRHSWQKRSHKVRKNPGGKKGEKKKSSGGKKEIPLEQRYDLERSFPTNEMSYRGLVGG